MLYVVLIFIATSLKSTVVRNCSCLQMYINNITSLKLCNGLGKSCIGCFCSGYYYHVLVHYETVCTVQGCTERLKGVVRGLYICTQCVVNMKELLLEINYTARNY